MGTPNRFLQITVKTGLALSILCLCLASFAQEEAIPTAPVVAPPEKPIYANNAERDNELIAKALTAMAKADELVWLETPNEKLLSLYKAGETRKTKGALLILHAPVAPQSWPASLENLRRHLPLYSWATMAVPLPVKYSPPIPTREPITQTSDATATADTAPETPTTEIPATEPPAAQEKPVEEPPKVIIARDILIAERTSAAIKQLNTLGQFNLVVLVDNSSAPDALTELYKRINKSTTTDETIDGPVQALILVNLQEQEPLAKEQLIQIFSVSDMPIMDVFFNPDNSVQADQRRVHKAEAMRQNLKDYQQFILPALPPIAIEDSSSFWLTKIHGFLAKKAEGNEISNTRGK